MKLQAVTTVFYNMHRPELFFSVAAIVREWERPGSAVIGIPADPSLLGDESRINRLIAEGLSHPDDWPEEPIYGDEDPNYYHGCLGDNGYDDDYYYYYDDDDDYLDEDDEDDDISSPEHLNALPPVIRFCLLDIGPKNAADMENIISFVDRHEDQIVLWIDSSHDWMRNEIVYLNYRRTILNWQRELPPLELVKRLDYAVEPDWLAAEKVLANITQAGLDENALARRYYEAISASTVISRNIGEDGSSSVFMSIAYECADQTPYLMIDDMCLCYQDMKQITAEALEDITDNMSFLRHLRRIQRPAGYLDLGLTPDHTDIMSILNEGSRRFPWLFILIYKLENDGIERLEAVSDVLGEREQAAAKNCDDRLDKPRLLRTLGKKIRSVKPSLTGSKKAPT